MLVHEVTDAIGGSTIIYSGAKAAIDCSTVDEPEQASLPWYADDLDTAAAYFDQMSHRPSGRRSPEAISARG